MKSQKNKDKKILESKEKSYIKKDPETSSALNALLIPVSIVLAGVLIMVSILISSKAILDDKVITKENFQAVLADSLKNANISGSGNNAVVPTTNTAYDKNKVVDVAVALGLNKDDFTQCYENRTYEGEIQKDFADADAAGMTGTPGFVIGTVAADGTVTGYKVPGAYPYDSFKQVIDAVENGTAAEVLKNSPEFTPATTKIDDDPIKGNKTAKIAIVEFSDFECPFCQRHFKQVYPSLLQNYIDPGKAFLVYRDNIAVQGHNPAAMDESLAAECVKALSKSDETYFKFHDYIYTNSRVNGLGLP